MTSDDDLEQLLCLHGTSYEMADGYVVEFKAERTDVTDRRPHGINYTLVLRPTDGEPLVRFVAHAVARPGGQFVKPSAAFDQRDPGRPYASIMAAKVLEDFWAAVKRVMDELGIPNDL
jgi:hypothetical protein